MAVKPVVLRLNGKPLNLNPPTPSLSRVIAFLDKQSPEDLFSSDELAKRSGVGSVRSAGFAKNEALDAYSLRSGRLRYWGNPKAIIALRKRLESAQ